MRAMRSSAASAQHGVMNRRRFLGAGLASAAGACGMLPKESAVAPPRVALADVRRLVVERADPIAGRCRYVADLGTRQVAQPILVARRGETFDAVLENALPQPTTVHFHGLTLPEAADGAMRPYAPSVEDCLHGWLGNRALVNGQLDTRWTVRPGWVRLQLLNACNARGLLLAFRDGETLVPFHLLGTDGGLLAAPRELERVFLYTGERVDIGIDLRGRRALVAVSLEFDPRHHTQGAAPRHRHPARERYAPLAAETVCESASGGAEGRLEDGAELALFALRVDGTPMRTPPLPSRLSVLPEPAVQPAAPTRRMRLDFDERAGFLIDQAPYRADEIAFSVSRGAREVWEIKNSPISMPHPMHLHGFGFRVLRRQGTYGEARRLATEPGGRLATDLGVKDTVVLWPNETVWLAVDFTLPQEAAFPGAQRFMFHCHNLEHEDGMMMRNFSVI